MDNTVTFRLSSEEKQQLAKCHPDGKISAAAREAVRVLIQAQKSEKSDHDKKPAKKMLVAVP